MRSRPVIYGLVGALAFLAIGGLWLGNREATCRDLVGEAQWYGGDMQVRRNSAGECYKCRPDGPIFDVLFEYCMTGDRVEWRGQA